MDEEMNKHNKECLDECAGAWYTHGPGNEISKECLSENKLIV